MKKLLAVLMALIFALTACSSGAAAPAISSVVAAPAASVQVSADTSSASAAVQAVTSTTLSTVAGAGTSAAVTAEVVAENSPTHDDPADYVWDSATVVPITLAGTSITANNAGVTVSGSQATITAAGTYSLSGSLSDGQIIIDTQDTGVVRLILNGVDVHSSTSAPIYIRNAKKTVIILAGNSRNVLSDGTSYVFEDAAKEEPNAVIFSKSDLTIAGGGALTVNGNAYDGITSKDGLIIAGGTLTVKGADEGIRGKDYLVIKDGTLTVTAGSDGLKSDNAEDAAKGYISIAGGAIQVTSGGDAITAQTDVLITAGTFTLTSGGGSGARIAEAASAKGIKGLANVNIEGGTFTIDSADDTLHSNGNLVIGNGAFKLASGDDAAHADATLTVNGGDIQVTKSYEGLESAVITINNGTIHIVSSDDGVNVATGNDGSGTDPGWGQRQSPGGKLSQGVGQDTFTYTGKNYLYVNGGYIAVTAGGDGLDINGAIEMTGGIVLVNGPTANNNGALDYDAGFKMTGGFLVAAGSSGMAMAPGSASTQNSVLLNLSSTLPSGTLIRIQNAAGEDIVTFAPTKQYHSLAISSPKLVQGETYTVYTGGKSTGTLADSLYQGGTYTPGTKYTTFSISGVTTMVGTARSRP